MSSYEFDFDTLFDSYSTSAASKLSELYSAPAQGRDPTEIRNEAKNHLTDALNNVVFGFSTKTSPVLPYNEATALEGDQDVLSEQFKKHGMASLVVFAMQKGTFSVKRYWVMFSKSKDSTFYFSLPNLLLVGRHSSLVTALSDRISGLLKEGSDSAMTAFIEQAGGKFIPSRRKYAFSRGYHVKGFPVEHLQDAIHDISKFFDLISDPAVRASQKPKGNFQINPSDFKFFLQQ